MICLAFGWRLLPIGYGWLLLRHGGHPRYDEEITATVAPLDRYYTPTRN